MVEIEKALRTFVDRQGGSSHAAKVMGVHETMVSHMLHGRRRISKRIAAKLGYRREVVYRKIKGAA